MPDWIVKLARRVLGLQPGYIYELKIIRMPDGDTYWAVTETSKIECP